ncbi:MAG: type IV pilus secretin PilQ [Nitrospinales bacterium]
MNKTYFRKTIICLLTVLFVIGNISFTVAETFDLEKNTRKITDAVRVAQASGGLSSITELTALEEGNGLTVEIHGSDTLNYTAFKLLNPLRLVLDFNEMGQGDLTDRIEVNRGGVSFINPIYIPESDVLRVEIALSSALAYDIQKPASNQLAIKFSPVPDSANTGGFQFSSNDPAMVDSCSKQLSGEKERISLDFQNANIKDIFRILADISGYNILLAPGVQGNANIRLMDVPWNEGLEILIKNNQLGRECDGNIIRIASQALIAAGREAGLLVTEMIRINYAGLPETITTLSGMKSARGSINLNERSSTIIITDVKQNIDDMKSVIKALDLPTPQVTIEARMVEVNSDSLDELGFSWGIDHSSNHDANFPAVFDVTGQTDKVTDPLIQAFPGFNVDLPITNKPAGQLGLQFANLMGNTVLNVQLQALESRSLARTISNPKITTLDNREAIVAKGRRVPFQTFSGTDGAQVEFLEGEVKLTVTPHITPDNRINMKIAALNNTIVPGGNNLFVTVNTSEAFTNVIVNDGETTVLGGLFTDNTIDNADSVPFLKDIPLLGYFFANSLEGRTLDELIIFITPTIVRNNDL